MLLSNLKKVGHFIKFCGLLIVSELYVVRLIVTLCSNTKMTIFNSAELKEGGMDGCYFYQFSLFHSFDLESMLVKSFCALMAGLEI